MGRIITGYHPQRKDKELGQGKMSLIVVVKCAREKDQKAVESPEPCCTKDL